MNGPLRKRLGLVAMVLLGMYLVLGAYFAYGQLFYGNRWFARSSNPRSHFVTLDPSVVPGDILDRDGEKLAYSVTDTYQDDSGETHLSLRRDYHPDIRCASHAVGFQDHEKGQAGAEAFYSRYLLGYNNNVLESVYQKVFLHQEVGNTVKLTIDLKLQKDVTRYMGGRTGSAVILDAATGEVYAMVSLPNFDPADVGGVEGDDLVNRATEGLYAPGSVMKIVTAASALENISDISAVTGMTRLKELKLNENPISDFSPLAGLTALSKLHLFSTGISDISVLSGLYGLTLLAAQDNSISDLTPIAGLQGLTTLQLGGNQISDITPLSELYGLQVLYLQRNQITDLSPLRYLSDLTDLSLGSQSLGDISVIGELPNLVNLFLNNTGIADLSPLSGLARLKTLNVNDNTFDADAQAILGALAARGCEVVTE